MDPVTFPEVNLIAGKDQPQYRPLPCHVSPTGVVTFCWKLTADELERVLVTGCVWHQVHTFGMGLQPQLLLAAKPVL